jgi:hypothetical protein
MGAVREASTHLPQHALTDSGGGRREGGGGKVIATKASRVCAQDSKHARSISRSYDLSDHSSPNSVAERNAPDGRAVSVSDARASHSADERSDAGANDAAALGTAHVVPVAKPDLLPD